MIIKGKVLVNTLMFQMEVGQEGFLSTDAIMIVNNEEIFINTGMSISEVKMEDKHIIPIKRTGPNIDDFEIDLDIAISFYNNKCTEEERTSIMERKNSIGPFKVDTEKYHPENYREQMYPRMDVEELANALAANNSMLENVPGDDVYIGNVKVIRRLIKEKIQKLSLQELKMFQKTFLPLTEEQIETGEMVNYAGDERIHQLINTKIQELKNQKQLGNMNREELETELALANENQDFERSIEIVKIMKEK
jgi:hypothetical protein